MDVYPDSKHHAGSEPNMSAWEPPVKSERQPLLRPSRRRALALLAGLGTLAMTPAARSDWWWLGRDMWRFLRGEPDLSGVSTAERIEALHEALIIVTHTTTEVLGRRNGFYGNPEVRIPLPEVLETARRSLDRIGMAEPLHALDERMNRAAEAAAPRARPVFVEAIFALDLENANAVLTGPADGATRYLEAHMRKRIGQALQPIVRDSLDEAEALETYRDLEDRMRRIPFLANVGFDPVEHVLEHTLNGLFHIMAEEEVRLRADPTGHGSDVFQRVFQAL